MARNTRFDSSAASPEELASEQTFVNGRKRKLINGGFNGSTSLCKGNDSQLLTSSANVLRGNSTYAGDAAPLDQSLILDPTAMGDQRYIKSSKLRRVLEMPFGATLPVAPEEMKRFKAYVQEASANKASFWNQGDDKACVQEASANKASFWNQGDDKIVQNCLKIYSSKTLDQSSNTLNKCREAVNSKKQLPNELLPNEKMNRSHLSTMGSQTHRSPAEIANQRLEDRPKCVRTSAAKIQTEGQNNSFARQPLANGKGRYNIRDNGKFCDVIEEKIQRLPAEGETCNRNVKRKRSMGTVFARPIDGEIELNRAMHPKPANESCLQSFGAQGLSTSRGSSVLKTGISSRKEKLEISTLARPIQNIKPPSEKSISKSRRPPLKKSCNRKAITRLGHPTSNSPDIAGESDVDHEELLDAANFASNASYIGCSSPFWKKVEPIFAPVNLEDIARMKQMVKTVEVDQKCLSQMPCHGSDASDGVVLSDNLLSQSPLEGERVRSILNQTALKEMSSMIDMIDQHHDGSFLCRQIDSEGSKVTPLYKRVLAALIIDDQTDEETVGDGNKSVLCERDDSPLVACLSQDVENRSNTRRTDYGFDTNMVSCNKNANFTRGINIPVQELDSLFQVGQGPLHPKTRSLPMLSEKCIGKFKSPCSSSVELHVEQMSMDDRLKLELRILDLYPEEAVPGLADGDCKTIDQDIIQLQNELSQQLIKKREHLMKLIQAAEESREMEQRALEQVAMDKLVELAYKKKLATCGSSAARYGLSKVSRPVASAFMKRTLARCRKFEETGKSCFLEPELKNVLFATPARDNYADSDVAENLPLAQKSQQESALPGSFPCRKQNVLGNPDNPSETGSILNIGKKKEVLLDDVGASALKPASTLVNSLMGGAKEKRNEKERDKDKPGRKRGVNTRGKRKTKAKGKPKKPQLSTSVNGSLSKLMENTNSELPIEAEEPLNVRNMHVLDPIELVVANELDGNQDLDLLANIDDVDLEDDDDGFVGLAIPMDDLHMVI